MQTVQHLLQSTCISLTCFLRNHCRSIKQFVKNYEQSNKLLDILVNNASIFITEDGLTEDGLEVHAHLHFDSVAIAL